MARLVLVLLDVRIPREEMQLTRLGQVDSVGAAGEEVAVIVVVTTGLRRARARAHAAERRGDDADVHVGDRPERRLGARRTSVGVRLQRIGERADRQARLLVDTLRLHEPAHEIRDGIGEDALLVGHG